MIEGYQEGEQTSCYREGCDWPANYWYFELGQRIGMCFGHATECVHMPAMYGRRERKERP